MEHNMILSASGWRKIFAASGDEQDKTPVISEEDRALCIIAGEVYFDYIKKMSNQEIPVIAVGTDSRPTGPAIADAIIRILIKKGAIIQYSAVTSAPEIMAYAKKLDGFIYISASHNPIGHNGIKFGTNEGGVLNAEENAKLIEDFTNRIKNDEEVKASVKKADSCTTSELKTVYDVKDSSKHNALFAYKNFARETITGTDNKEYQNDFFGMLATYITECPVGVVCDFNGSSRYLSIDREFFAENKIDFHSINEFNIAHEIIPEGDNLKFVAEEMENLHKKGYENVILGYMPDCDGDRGNIVYWNEKKSRAEILQAQEVFSLSVLAELTYSIWQHSEESNFKPAIAVNCPTSMRIEEIAEKLGAKVFRAEVGEANVVNLARKKRNEGYNIRILGEGSNGGTITYPSSVRDPLNTIFALLKLLLMKENGLYKMWCEKSGHKYKENYTLTDVIESLPEYTTTGVSDPRALLKIKANDHSVLKKNFQTIFEKEWKSKSKQLKKDFDICDYEAVITKGTEETRDVKDFSLSGKGGLKIIFKNSKAENIAFIWMRGSGTEKVFRIMCDVKGNDDKACKMEKELLQWETQMLEKADK